MNKKALQSAIALAGVSAFALTACTGPSGGGTATGGASGGSTITYGTTDKVVTLDPAGSYDAGSFMVMNQIYPFLLNSKPGTADSTPDIAESASFTSPTEYTVKLKPGLKFANGHALTSSDVKFSIDRVVKIADHNGPASLLGNLDSVAAKDASTVVFTLKAGNDQVFPGVLAANAGPIIDEEVFPADKLLTDDEIVKGKPFAGPYTIESYKKNELVSLKVNPDYQGLLGKPANGGATIKYYADSNNLKLDVQQGNIDVAGRSLTATDAADLEKDSKVKVHKGPGGETALHRLQLRHHAVRRQVCRRRSREGPRRPPGDGQRRRPRCIAEPGLQGHLPAGLLRRSRRLRRRHPAAQGNVRRRQRQAQPRQGQEGLRRRRCHRPGQHQAAVQPGPLRQVLRRRVRHDQGTAGEVGLFTVELQSTEWVTYSKDRTADPTRSYQLGWFPDYSDADNYLTPFFVPGNFLKNHYETRLSTT